MRFLGEFAYSADEKMRAPDTEGNMRDAIVFTLRRLGVESDDVIPEALNHASLKELRLRAYTPVSSTGAKPRITQIRQRRGDVKAYALKRADGRCECCGTVAPFFNKQGDPFLEVHHIQKLSDYGLDSPDNVAALTPNCHRRIHQGADGAEIDARLAKSIKAKELATAKTYEVQS